MRNSWSFVCHLDYNGAGAMTVIKSEAGHISAKKLPTAAATGQPNKPVFLGVDAHDQAILMDPVSKTLRISPAFPSDAYVPYAYRSPDGRYLWFVNDGDKEQGIDALNCTTGSSVTIIRIEDHSGQNTPPAEHIKTLCVGRGHHVTTFSYPSAQAPHVPLLAFVSNLKDGTISVVGHNPDDSNTYLKVITTLNLCEPDKEKGAKTSVPNGAFPHGMVYSPVTGKIYNHNNGYGTIAVINPRSLGIEKIIDLPVCSNLLLSPNGRYLIGKGVDRSVDPQHVIGRLSIVDAVSGAVISNLDLPDVYPSTYRFNPDGTRLYVTTAVTGKGPQKDHQKKKSVLVYDTSALPKISLATELAVGLADCGRRPIAFHEEGGQARWIFIPNPSDGTLSLVDGATHKVAETLEIGAPGMTELNFCFWDSGKVYGC